MIYLVDGFNINDQTRGMNMAKKAGRHTESYRTSWGEEVKGLTKTKDGRWRISATRQRFAEESEARAVQRFKDVMASRAPIPVQINKQLPAPDFAGWAERYRAQGDEERAAEMAEFAKFQKENPIQGEMVWGIPQNVFWPWLREQLINNSPYLAKMTGLPELASFQHLPIPKTPLLLSDILRTYVVNARGTKETKRLAENTFNEFIQITHAKTLADLNLDNIKQYRDTIKARLSSPSSVGAYFSRVKWIIKFAKSEGLDPVQVDHTLSLLAVLKAPQDNRKLSPIPISRGNLHALLAIAHQEFPDWYPRLLLMLNCCLHFGELVEVRWDEINLELGTYCSHRNKRGKVIRCATLWPETLEAVKKVKRTGSPYVFVSQWGGPFNPKGQWKTWEKIRNAAKCPTVQLDEFRNGAYTAACQAPGVDEKFARLLAGQRSPGLQDNYVERNPTIVKPACDAVYKVYGPF